MILTKTFNLYSGSPDQPKVLILAFTGVAAININGTAINSGLSIPPYVNGYTLPRFSHSERGRLINLYSEVLVVLIDEISMVSNICLLHIHKRLCEIFGCSESQPFTNSFLVVGDLLHLPTIKSPQIIEPDNNGFGDLFNLWSLFVKVELTEVMWQKGDENFVSILNNIRIGKCSEDNVKQIQMRKIPNKNVNPDPTLLFAESSPKDDYNASKIGQLNHLEIKIESIDVFPDSLSMHLQTSLSSRSSSTTASLSSLLKLKKGVRVMVTSNIDLADRLINGQFGVVFDFAYIDSSLTKVYVKLHDQNAGKNAMSKDLYSSKYKAVPIQRIKANIITSKTSSEIFKRTQFPPTLAWTCTAHKVQGLTLLNSTVASLELIKQRSFSPGQIYVALSRSFSLSKLNILSDSDPKIIKPNHLALEHYEYRIKEKNLFTQGSSLKKNISCIFKYMWISNKYFRFHW